MKIKQQKQIKKFLFEEFGKEKGTVVFEKQNEVLKELITNTKNKSKNQMKTLTNTILPHIALYKVLQKEDLPKDEVTNYMRKYMIEKIAQRKHSSTVKMEIVPGFYSIYSKVFLKIMRTTDLQKSEQKCGKGFFDVTIKKCLWHTACIENDCPELCRLFCDVDNVTYGGLKKIGFTRTQTLGYDGECCDFHFYKK
ncbi:MAG TPA: hypothetical protein DHU62_02640 [Firmicutes bacterium]|nr:hypothetical protein [Bacillota bacterium]